MITSPNTPKQKEIYNDVKKIENDLKDREKKAVDQQKIIDAAHKKVLDEETKLTILKAEINKMHQDLQHRIGDFERQKNDDEIIKKTPGGPMHHLT